MENVELERLIESYSEKRSVRLSAENKARLLKVEEDALRNTMVAELERRKTQEYKTGKFEVALYYIDNPVCDNWPELFKFIRDNNAFDLVHKRLTISAVKARWDDGINMPGVHNEQKPEVTVVKNEGIKS